MQAIYASDLKKTAPSTHHGVLSGEKKCPIMRWWRGFFQIRCVDSLHSLMASMVPQRKSNIMTSECFLLQGLQGKLAKLAGEGGPPPPSLKSKVFNSCYEFVSVVARIEGYNMAAADMLWFGIRDDHSDFNSSLLLPGFGPGQTGYIGWVFSK